ncbi:Helix-turn-helix domain-containing protein [Halogranum amylolyticum]|uniref:Helix-turn-helix domain-containing protein n=1 Tax=Halogranum amylolyticum TaxID=660520 RepID=A0A1H8PCU6_9EURY|nr:helix-turn-helix domain-containing protein [Halogranum amylolyticum]SEO39597.1 Helix-turn-helix domain-containing protein [Halogranum amylolyticum]
MTRRLELAAVVSVTLLVLSSCPLLFALEPHAASPSPNVDHDVDAEVVDLQAAGDWTGSTLVTTPLMSTTSDVVAPVRHALTPVAVSVQQGAVQSGEVDPLENDTRRRIYEAVERAPGTYVARLVERTSIPRSTVRYHLRVLADAGLVTSEAVRGKQRYVASGDDADATLAAAYTDEATATLLDALRRTMPVTVSELADEIDRTPGTVSHHLDRLESEGLVERERVGNAVMNTLAGPARDVVVDGSPDGDDYSAVPSDD